MFKIQCGSWCVPMNEEYEQQQLISDAGYIGAATVLSIIGIVGFLFNACVIFIMFKDSQVNTNSIYVKFF